MGACYDDFNVRADNVNDAIKACNEHIDDCQYENGHGGYTGTMAECNSVHMTNEVFGSDSDAEDWLEENASKFGPALGVIVRDPRKDQEYYKFGAICSE